MRNQKRKTNKQPDGGRIEICGGIASGKTTLGALLKEAGLPTVFEDFRENPFWSLFNQDPKFHAFETEVTFLLQHYSQLKIARHHRRLASDFSLLQDLAYAETNLRDRPLAAFRAVYRAVIEELSQPSLIVHLECPADEQLMRVRRRARVEETSLTVGYLEALNQVIRRRIGKVKNGSRVLTIDSGTANFSSDPAVREQVLERIFAIF